MAHIEESIEINGPVGKVFALTTDAAQWSRWHTAIPEAEQTSEGPVGVGTTFRGVTRLMGRSMPWTAVATGYEPDVKFGKNIDSGSVFIEQNNAFTPTPRGTKFTLTYDMKFSGCMRILSPFIVNAMRKEMKKSLVNLKEIVEK
ncbi:MAG TPA: SRPBCC family protein [Methanoregulaceae archaeon]|nr:SRPBCC family protein [Methanoregulaceae archaeon]